MMLISSLTVTAAPTVCMNLIVTVTAQQAEQALAVTAKTPSQSQTKSRHTAYTLPDLRHLIDEINL